MASTKITAMTANTDPQDTDLFTIVDDVGGTPVNQKITWLTIKEKIRDYYNSVTATVTNKTIDADNNTLSNIGAAEVIADLITGQAELTGNSPVATTDEILLSDAGVIKRTDIIKVLDTINNLTELTDAVAGDKIPIYDASGNVTKWIDFDNLPSGATWALQGSEGASIPDSIANWDLTGWGTDWVEADLIIKDIITDTANTQADIQAIYGASTVSTTGYPNATDHLDFITGSTWDAGNSIDAVIHIEKLTDQWYKFEIGQGENGNRLDDRHFRAYWNDNQDMTGLRIGLSTGNIDTGGTYTLRLKS